MSDEFEEKHLKWQKKNFPEDPVMPPFKKYTRFVLTDEMIDKEIEPILDETGGMLIKRSELKFIVEKYVNRALGIND